jgi:sugar/nucleoside kinase (ribokinase family)
MGLLVVGSIALDDVATPEQSREAQLGGAASYFAVAASYFSHVRAVGVVGDDFPAEHLEFLDSRDIDIAGIKTTAGSTFRYGCRYRPSMNQRDTTFTELGVFEGFDPDLPNDYRDSRFVFLANIHPELQLNVLTQADSRVFAAMDTMNFWIEGTREELGRTLAEVNALVINDEEAAQLTGHTNLPRAAEAIRRLGPSTVVIKRGEHGAVLFDDAGIFSAPAFPLRDVVDPTGAGDSFAGGLMGWLAQVGKLDAEELRRAVIYGSVMASFCVEDFSLDRFRTLESADITARFEEFRALTRF